MGFCPDSFADGCYTCRPWRAAALRCCRAWSLGALSISLHDVPRGHARDGRYPAGPPEFRPDPALAPAVARTNLGRGAFGVVVRLGFCLGRPGRGRALLARPHFPHLSGDSRLAVTGELRPPLPARPLRHLAPARTLFRKVAASRALAR